MGNEDKNIILSDSTNLTGRNYIRQQHAIVNAKYALTRSEIDIILVLLTAIKKEDEDFKDYKFTKMELEKKTGKKLNTKQLQNTIDGLFKKPIRIKESDNKWKIMNWFSYFEYDNGVITCRFDKELKPYLIDMQGRMVISDIRYLLPMKSSYSKRIYLLIKEHANFGWRKFKVDELQEILKVPDSFKVYGEFNKKVLKKAESSINKFSDLEVSFEETKKIGKKVVEITFYIKKNQNDMKTFMSIIRENYYDKPLYKTLKNRIVKCNEKGKLYYEDNGEFLDEITSKRTWEQLHEKRRQLMCFIGNE